MCKRIRGHRLALVADRLEKVCDAVPFHARVEAILKIVVYVDHNRDGFQEAQTLVDVDPIVDICIPRLED
jgi:hypothetical protein